MPDRIVYLNGEYLPKGEATLGVDERGVLFADGVYEVVRYFHGRAFAAAEHRDRMARSLDGIDLRFDVGKLPAVSDEVVGRNGLAEARVYWQVTRGPSPRNHVIDGETEPTVYVGIDPVGPLAHDAPLAKATAVTTLDDRWQNCWIKSLMLLPNSLAKTRAHAEGAGEAIFVRDGRVTEGSSTNVFAVFDGELYTHPADRYILEGITRGVIIDLAKAMGVAVHEQAFNAVDLPAAEECFMTGTGTLMAALTAVDGKKVGSGKTGELTHALWEAFVKRVHADCPVPSEAVGP